MPFLCLCTLGPTCSFLGVLADWIDMSLLESSVTSEHDDAASRSMLIFVTKMMSLGILVDNLIEFFTYPMNSSLTQT